MELILIPTGGEHRHVAAELEQLSEVLPARVELCGWGPVHSACWSQRHIHRHQPKRVWLLGIAGCYHPDFAPGLAYEFTEVGFHGVGVGSGSQWMSPESLNWNKSFDGPDCPGSVIRIRETDLPSQNQLLSVCAASASYVEVQQKRHHFPQAVAEDMETYSVAAVCQRCDVPLRVIRGISNQAGDRDLNNWHVATAMQSAFQLLRFALDSGIPNAAGLELR